MAAQSNIGINIINLSSIALTVANITPPSSQWSSNGGATQPNEGDTIGIASTPSVNYLLSNGNNVNTTGNMILTGNYNNQWLLLFSWDQTGVPKATLQSLSMKASGISVAGYPGGMNVFPLAQVDVVQSDTALYQVVFNKP